MTKHRWMNWLAGVAVILAAAVVLASAGGAGSASAAGLGEMAAGTERFNAIALPLDVKANWAASSIPFNAQGLAQFIGVSSVSQVLRLNPSIQGYDSWFPGGGFGFIDGGSVTEPFLLEVGKAYRVVINNTDPLLTRMSLVGSVPAAGSISNILVASGAGCKFNDLMIPLDQPSITNASELATSMGDSANVEQILQLNASLQGYDSWFPAGGFGFVNGALVNEPFQVRAGYPYAVCLKSSADGQVWP